VVHKQPDGAPHLYIDNLGVAPAEQRQGLGRILLVSLLAWGKQYGCELCWVATETDNAQALAFYAATGFEQKTLAWLEIDLTSL
jgi:aminoglycoside 6'-N-acetyltransferase I